MILQHFWWILKQKSLRLGRNLWTLNHSRKTFLLCWQIMRNCVIIWKRLSLLRCDCTFVWWVKVKNNVFVFFLPGVRDYVLGTILGTYLFTFSFYVFTFFFTFSFFLGTYTFWVRILMLSVSYTRCSGGRDQKTNHTKRSSNPSTSRH